MIAAKKHQTEVKVRAKKSQEIRAVTATTAPNHLNNRLLEAKSGPKVTRR